MQKQTQVEKLKRDLEELKEELGTVRDHAARINSAAAVRLGTAIQMLAITLIFPAMGEFERNRDITPTAPVTGFKGTYEISRYIAESASFVRRR